MPFKIPAEKSSIFAKPLESVAAFWKPALYETARAKTARINQHLHEIFHDYSAFDQKYSSDTAAAFQQRVDIGKARQLNSSRNWKWCTNHSGHLC